MLHLVSYFFFFNDTATTEIYTLSLHDALPISSTWRSTRGSCGRRSWSRRGWITWPRRGPRGSASGGSSWPTRSEEHTSELQSLAYLVCRLLLEKKKKKKTVLARRPRVVNGCRS